MTVCLNRSVNRNRQESDVLFKIGVDFRQGDIGAVLVWKYDLFLYLQKLHVCCMACSLLILKAVCILNCMLLFSRLKSKIMAFSRVKKSILFNAFLNFQSSLFLLYFKKYIWWYVPSLVPPIFPWVLPCLAWAWKIFLIFILGTSFLLPLFPHLQTSDTVDFQCCKCCSN